MLNGGIWKVKITFTQRWYQRAILVFGAPCSGKTTFSKQFAAQFNATFYDLTP